MRLAQAAKGDANDSLWASEEIMDYKPEPDLDKKRVRHGGYVLIRASEKTHGHFAYFYAEVWKPYPTMADRAGARSQVAQLVFAGVVLSVLVFLTGPLQYLPRCVSASIVFTIAVG